MFGHDFQAEEEEKLEVCFNPYMNNGGTILAVAGKDFTVVAADSRLSKDSSILTRDQNKLFPLTSRTVMASTGCWCDTIALTSVVTMQKDMYFYEHKKEMTTSSIAQMLSNAMYCKRTFPYYVFNALAGLDEQGAGCVYNFDIVGHYERVMYHSGGCASIFLLPLMDNQIGKKNMITDQDTYLAAYYKTDKTNAPCPTPVTADLPRDEVVAIVKDLFVTAAERDVYTGDGVYLNVISVDGIEEERFELRQD